MNGRKLVSVACVVLLGVFWALTVTAADQVTLTWWDPDSREEWINATQYVMDNFESETGIKIERINVPWNDLDKKIQASAMAGSLPDLVYAYHNYHSAWAFQGHIVPLDDVLDKLGRETFYKAHLDMGTVDGKSYTVPFEFHPHIVYYRKDLYEKYGLSIPTTWDELYQNAKTINDQEEGVYGFMVYNGPGNPYVLIDLMGCNGAATFDKENNVIINSPETVETLAYIQKLNEMSPPGALKKASSDLRIPFVTGQGAHMLDSTSLANAIYSENKIDQFGAFSMPVNNGDRQTMNDFGGWVVTKQANIDVAKQFIEFFNRKDQFMYYAQYEVIGHIPANKLASESDEYLDHERIAPFKDMFKAAIAVAETGVGVGMTNGPNKYTGVVRSQDIWVKMVDMMVLQDKSPEEIAEWAQEAIEEIKEDME